MPTTSNLPNHSSMGRRSSKKSRPPYWKRLLGCLPHWPAKANEHHGKLVNSVPRGINSVESGPAAAPPSTPVMSVLSLSPASECHVDEQVTLDPSSSARYSQCSAIQKASDSHASAASAFAASSPASEVLRPLSGIYSPSLRPIVSSLLEPAIIMQSPPQMPLSPHPAIPQAGPNSAPSSRMSFIAPANRMSFVSPGAQSMMTRTPSPLPQVMTPSPPHRPSPTPLRPPTLGGLAECEVPDPNPAPESPAATLHDRYTLGSRIGSGTFADVFQVVHRETGATYALKSMRKRKQVAHSDEGRRELTVLRSLSAHPHVVGLVEGPDSVFETEDSLHLVMELCTGGELFDAIIERGFFSERDAMDVMRQVIDAISFCHATGVIHRDLKPENLLLKDKQPNARVMVADFGLARLAQFEDEVFLTACGTPAYCAPEIILHEGHGKPADMWSLGCIAYVLLCGYLPFSGESQSEVFQAIINARYEFDEEYWSDVSEGAKDFIRRLLLPYPAQRMSVDEAQRHPWFQPSTPTPESTLNRVPTLKRGRGRRQQQAAADHLFSGCRVAEALAHHDGNPCAARSRKSSTLRSEILVPLAATAEPADPEGNHTNCTPQTSSDNKSVDSEAGEFVRRDSLITAEKVDSTPTTGEALPMSPATGSTATQGSLTPEPAIASPHDFWQHASESPSFAAEFTETARSSVELNEPPKGSAQMPVSSSASSFIRP